MAVPQRFRIGFVSLAKLCCSGSMTTLVERLVWSEELKEMVESYEIGGWGLGKLVGFVSVGDGVRSKVGFVVLEEGCLN